MHCNGHRELEKQGSDDSREGGARHLLQGGTGRHDRGHHKALQEGGVLHGSRVTLGRGRVGTDTQGVLQPGRPVDSATEVPSKVRTTGFQRLTVRGARGDSASALGLQPPAAGSRPACLQLVPSDLARVDGGIEGLVGWGTDCGSKGGSSALLGSTAKLARPGWRRAPAADRLCMRPLAAAAFRSMPCFA